MSDDKTLQELKDKLAKVLRSKAVLSERSKQLQKQLEDFRRREDQNDHVVSEMLDRQREMNFMLYRANSVLQRIQEANAMLSTEFTELVKELPAPENPDWEDRVKKINDLFQKTGSLADEITDDIFHKGIIPDRSPAPAEPAPDVVSNAVPPPAVPEPEPEPEPVITPEPAPEPVIQAEVVSQSEVEEDQDVPEEQHEPDVVVDVEIKPLPDDPELHDRLERLFGSTKLSDDLSTEDSPAPSKSNKPGFLSRLWKRKKVDSKADTDTEETVEKDEQVEQCVDNEHIAQEALSELLDDTTSELEHLSFEFIPVETTGSEAEQFEPQEKPQKVSLFKRWKQNLDAERLRRVTIMLDRAEKRRLKTINPDDHASAA